MPRMLDDAGRVSSRVFGRRKCAIAPVTAVSLQPCGPGCHRDNATAEPRLHCPLTSIVTGAWRQAITVVGGSDGTAPAQLRAYVNREGLDFASIGDVPPVQQWDLQENLSGQMEYPTQ